MPIYSYSCVCGNQEEFTESYEERHKLGFPSKPCSCGGEMVYKIGAPYLMGMKRLTPPDVGPLSKKTRAYEKQQDDKHSSYYAPDKTFGQSSVAKFKETQRKMAQAEAGKTNFTK